ncbi:uncharacterized protein LOC124619661 [Schistocerca americana]|uniref:uncharacterized protein LOC124619661 n=1 Tax=Schistocerca americana TaxID=7009 RepID=UPI001F4F34F8|nr:uncharacterized protein LOC124619661 [Schistocerca americana]
MRAAGSARLALATWLLALAAAQQLPWWWGLSAPDYNPVTQAPNNNNVGGGSTPGPGVGEGASTVDPLRQSTYEPCECGAGRSCVCVLYYLCKNGTIVTTGLDLLDDRINTPKVEMCPGVQHCCQEPPRKTTGSQTPTTPPTPSTPPYVEPGPVTPTPKPPIQVPVGPVKSGCGVRRGLSPATDNSTTFAEFPWMLVVQVAVFPGDGKPPAFVFKCGASLLHPQVALTAAHCVKRLIPSDIKVRAGIWDLTAATEPLPHQERRVIKIIRHPQFEEKTLFNDIALLVLDKHFDEAMNVEVICVPPPSVDFTGLRCIATGWGTSSPDAEIVQTTMKKVELPVVSRDHCENELRMTRLGRYFELHGSFICAGGEPQVDTCRGSLLHNTSYTEAVPAEHPFVRNHLQENDDDSVKLKTDIHNLSDSTYHGSSLYGSGRHKRHAVSSRENIPNYGTPGIYAHFFNALGINPNTPSLQWLSQYLPFSHQGNPLTDQRNQVFYGWNPFLQGTHSTVHPNPLTPGKFPQKNDKQFDSKNGPQNSAENVPNSGGALYSYNGYPDTNSGNFYNGNNLHGSNINSGNPHVTSSNPQSFRWKYKIPGPNQNYPGPNQNYPGPNQNYPGPNQNYPGPNQNYPGPNQNYPGPNQNYPGPNQNYPGPNQNYPGPNQNYPGPNQNYPGPNQNYPGPNQNYPGPNQNYPGPNQNYPGPNQNYPGPNQNYPGPNQNYPGPNQNYPGPNQNYPGPNQNYPGPNQNYPGPNQNYPGPNQNYPGPNQNYPGPNQNYPGPNQNYPGPNQNYPGPNQNYPGPNIYQENANKDEHKNPWSPTAATNTVTPLYTGGVTGPQTNDSAHSWPQDSKESSTEVTPIDGDGGGPLMCPITDDDGRYVQVGIVSWGIGCGGSRTPAVYASLSYFRDWIDKQLEENKFINIAIPPPSVDQDERFKEPKPTWG